MSPLTCARGRGPPPVRIKDAFKGEFQVKTELGSDLDLSDFQTTITDLRRLSEIHFLQIKPFWSKVRYQNSHFLRTITVLFSVLHTKKMPKSLPVIGSSGPTLQQVRKEN
jgi:hypothetical protein